MIKLKSRKFPICLIAALLGISGFWMKLNSDEVVLPLTAKIIKHEGYTLAYDGRTRNAFWVYEKLTPESIQGDGDRSNLDFKEDPEVPELLQAKLADYKNSGFDRGHLAAAGNHKCSMQEMRDTFYLSNICPQFPQLNRGYWKKIEGRVRNLTKENRQVDTFTGPLYLPHVESDGKKYVTYQVIGQQNVAVPTHFFKLIFVKKNSGTTYTEAYIIPNEKITNDVPLEKFRTTLEKIENASGVLFKNRA